MAAVSNFYTFEIGPFTVQVGYDRKRETYFGRVYEGRRHALSAQPIVCVGSDERPILSAEGLRWALRDDAFDFGSEIPPTLFRDLERKKLREPDVADGTERN